MKVLELFAGSRSIGKICDELGYEVFSVDWENYDRINLSIDIELLTIDQIPFIPDVIWCSPDCTTYSIAAIGCHRNGIEPKSEYAKKCDNVNKNVILLINNLLKINPNLIFWIENPRGMLRKMPFMKNIEKATVWYCRYGDNRAKPTDIFTNNLYSLFNPNGWQPKKRCFNNNDKCHHDKSPRGSNNGKGTQGAKNAYERSIIPKELCMDILNSCKLKLLENKNI